MAPRVSVKSDYENKEWKDARGPLLDDLRHVMIVVNRLISILLNSNNIIPTAVIDPSTPIEVELQGDVAGGPSASPITTTISNDVVSYAKMQNVSAASRLLGRGSLSGAGDPEEITVGPGLAFTGTVLDTGSGTATSNSVALHTLCGGI
jgi:hypothetical protein